MAELSDFAETALPGNIPAKAAAVVLLKAPAMAGDALALVAHLAGFNPDVLADQARLLTLEHGEDAWRCRLYYGTRASELSHWPRARVDIESTVSALIALLDGSRWTADITARGLRLCPDPALAIAGLDAYLSTDGKPWHRLIAAQTLLAIDVAPLARARAWLSSEDPPLVRAGATASVSLYDQRRANVGDLQAPLLHTDLATRAWVRELLEQGLRPLPSALQTLIAQSTALPDDEWTCLRCGTPNTAGGGFCSGCRFNRW